MPFVRSISNHPYAGEMRPRGSVYEAGDDDVKLLESLKRVQRLSDQERRAFQGESREYETREMRAGAPAIMTTHGNVPGSETRAAQRRSRAPSPREEQPAQPPEDDDKK